MIQKFDAENFNDFDGAPSGGSVSGEGLHIRWQDGPLGRGADRREPNGAFVETVIAAVIQRIQHYQNSKFECQPNADALKYLRVALEILAARTQARELAGVEGTNHI